SILIGRELEHATPVRDGGDVGRTALPLAGAGRGEHELRLRVSARRACASPRFGNGALGGGRERCGGSLAVHAECRGQSGIETLVANAVSSLHGNWQQRCRRGTAGACYALRVE